MRGLIFTLVTRGIFAQPPIPSPADSVEKSVVAQLLSAADPGQLAWGAYLAANYQQKSFIPSIVPLLHSPDAGVRQSAIDALIRLDSDLPELELDALLTADNDPDPVLVLLAKSPKKHADFLMHLLDRPLAEPDWVAVNSILSMAPPPGFAARLLREWTLHFTVIAWDKTYTGLGAEGGGWAGDGGPGRRPGFPPLYFYVIQEGMKQGGTILAAGPHPVSFIRQSNPSRSGLAIDKDVYRLDYLRFLARLDPETARLPNEPASLPWTDAEAFRTGAATLLESIRTPVTALRHALTDRGLLTKEEALAGPNLQVTVRDNRQVSREPLPVIDWRLDLR
ncbi:MAG TPA: hypothetical protein VGN17_30055 [Bryobacteraceae bacterium]|jgi:hypothetical protein